MSFQNIIQCHMTLNKICVLLRGIEYGMLRISNAAVVSMLCTRSTRVLPAIAPHTHLTTTRH